MHNLHSLRRCTQGVRAYSSGHAPGRPKQPEQTYDHRKETSVSSLSYVTPTAESPWGTYLSQVDRVIP